MKVYCRTFSFMACMACMGFTLGDLVVPAGQPLVYSNATTFAAEHSVVTLENGATIQVTKDDAAPAGFIARKMPLGDTTLYSDDMQVPRDPQPEEAFTDNSPLNLYFDKNLASKGRGVWNYLAHWNVPVSGDYVFFSAFDDAVGIMIDGRSVLPPKMDNSFSASPSVYLEAGWHTLEILLYNNGGDFGYKLKNGFELGLGWAQSSTPFTTDTYLTANRFEDSGDGSKLKQIINGIFFRHLVVPTGTATLDMTASGLTGGGAFTIGGINAALQTGPDAALVVKGCTNLVFNGLDAEGGTHFPLLDANVVFKDDTDVEVDGAVNIYGRVSLKRIFPNYVFDESVDIAYWGTNMIDGVVWTHERPNAHLISTAAIAPTTRVDIVDNCTLSLKPCQHNPSDYWRWQGIAGVFSNDFTLVGSKSKLQVRAYRHMELTGAIRGAGTLVQADDCQEGPLVLSGDLSEFEGSIQTTQKGDIQINASAAGNGNERIVLGSGVTYESNHVSTVFFKPEGAPEIATTARASTVFGYTKSAYLEALSNQVVTVGRFKGTGGLRTANVTDSRIIVESIAEDAIIGLAGTANILLQNAGTNAAVHVFGSRTNARRIEFASNEQALAQLNIENHATVDVFGSGTILNVTGTGTLVVHGEISLLNAAPTVQVRMAEGGVVRDTGVKLDDVLGDLPALWLDASHPSTYQQYLNCVFTNGIVIRRWNDCRPTQTELFGLNPRGEGYVRVYPYVNTNALNGMNVVSMGSVGDEIELKYGHVNVNTGEPNTGDTSTQYETRRMPFNQPIRFRTAIVVYNSANGGGGAILGGWTEKVDGQKDFQGNEKELFSATQVECLLRRAKKEKEDLKNPSTAIFKTKRTTWLDGEAVDSTKTGYSGGWQIVSFNSATPEGEDVRSIGMMENYTTPGGMDYAEVLIYTNTLSDVERRAVETYLARKWNVGNLVTPASVPISGKGQVEVTGDLSASGAFSGTANVQLGARLDLSQRPMPPKEADVPSDGRVGWFDPDSEADLVTERTCEEDGDHIYALFDKGKPHVQGTYYLHGCYKPLDEKAASDRRPVAERVARGDGPVRTWMNFHETEADSDYDKAGNTLRFKDNPSLIQYTSENSESFYEAKSVTIRTAFIVSDSCYGGGNPISDDVRMEGLIRHREGSDWTKSIWAWTTDGRFWNGETRLNGVGVNGHREGFTGKPELLSFTTTNDFPASFFGYCGVNHKERSYEVLGEILLYNRVVEGDERYLIENYLMNKWLGVLGGDWCDWRRATITGAGTVAAASVEALPIFDASFTGALELSDISLSFHVNADGVVTDALTLPENATLNLPASGTVEVSFVDRPVSCTLATAYAITGIDPTQWRVTTQPATASVCRLTCSDGVLRLEVVPQGTLFIVR